MIKAFIVLFFHQKPSVLQSLILIKQYDKKKEYILNLEVGLNHFLVFYTQRMSKIYAKKLRF